VHVEEDKRTVPGLVCHEVDERLDGARLEIGFRVGVRVMADGVADAPNDVAEATEIKNVRPQAVVSVKAVVPAACELREWRRVSTVEQERRHQPDSHQRMHHPSCS
jgi:hypothetical protein